MAEQIHVKDKIPDWVNNEFLKNRQDELSELLSKRQAEATAQGQTIEALYPDFSAAVKEFGTLSEELSELKGIQWSNRGADLPDDGPNARRTELVTKIDELMEVARGGKKTRTPRVSAESKKAEGKKEPEQGESLQTPEEVQAEALRLQRFATDEVRQLNQRIKLVAGFKELVTNNPQVQGLHESVVAKLSQLDEFIKLMKTDKKSDPNVLLLMWGKRLARIQDLTREIDEITDQLEDVANDLIVGVDPLERLAKLHKDTPSKEQPGAEKKLTPLEETNAGYEHLAGELRKSAQGIGLDISKEMQEIDNTRRAFDTLHQQLTALTTSPYTVAGAVEQAQQKVDTLKQQLDDLFKALQQRVMEAVVDTEAGKKESVDGEMLGAITINDPKEGLRVGDTLKLTTASGNVYTVTREYAPGGQKFVIHSQREGAAVDAAALLQREVKVGTSFDYKVGDRTVVSNPITAITIKRGEAESSAPVRTVEHLAPTAPERDLERALDKARQLLLTAKAINPNGPSGFDAAAAEQQRTFLKQAHALSATVRQRRIAEHEAAKAAFDGEQAKRWEIRKAVGWEARAADERKALELAERNRNDAEALFGELSVLMVGNKDQMRRNERADWVAANASGTAPARRELPKDLDKVHKKVEGDPVVPYAERMKSVLAHELVTKRFEREDAIKLEQDTKHGNGLLKQAAALRERAMQRFGALSTTRKTVVIGGVAVAALAAIPLGTIGAAAISGVVGAGVKYAVGEYARSKYLSKQEAALSNAKVTAAQQFGAKTATELYAEQRGLRQQIEKTKTKIKRREWAAGLAAGALTGGGLRALGPEWLTPSINGRRAWSYLLPSAEGATLPPEMVAPPTTVIGSPEIVPPAPPEALAPTPPAPAAVAAPVGIPEPGTPAPVDAGGSELVRRIVPGEPRPLPIIPDATPTAPVSPEFVLRPETTLEISSERVAEAARGSAAPPVASEVAAVVPGGERIVTVERGNVLSRLLHQEMIDAQRAGRLSGVDADASTQRLARLMYEKFPEMRGADGMRATTPLERWALSPEEWRDVGVRSGNPNLIRPGDEIKIQRLLDIVNGRPPIEAPPSASPVIVSSQTLGFGSSLDVRPDGNPPRVVVPEPPIVEGSSFDSRPDGNPPRPIQQIVEDSSFDSRPDGNPPREVSFIEQVAPPAIGLDSAPPRGGRSLIEEMSGPSDGVAPAAVSPAEPGTYRETPLPTDGRLRTENLDLAQVAPSQSVVINASAAAENLAMKNAPIVVEQADLADPTFNRLVTKQFGSVEKFLAKREALVELVNPKVGFLSKLFSVAVNENFTVDQALASVTVEDFMATKQSSVDIAAALQEGDTPVSVSPESITAWRRAIPLMVSQLEQRGIEYDPEMTITELINLCAANDVSPIASRRVA